MAEGVTRTVSEFGWVIAPVGMAALWNELGYSSSNHLNPFSPL